MNIMTISLRDTARFMQVNPESQQYQRLLLRKQLCSLY